MATDYKHPILASMARTLFVLAWADYEESEHREPAPPGCDIFDYAPDYTPMGAKLKAEDIALDILNENGLQCDVLSGLDRLYHLAIAADEASDQTKDAAKSDPGTFGHYLVMHALGHGVNWFDDHAEFEVAPGKPFEMPDACDGCTMYKGDDGQPYLDFYLRNAA